MNRLKGQRKKIIVLLLILAGILLLVSCLLIAGKQQTPQTSQKQEEVKESGEFTETGSVDVGTKTQSFALDISEFSGSTSFSFEMGGMGGMDMMGGMSGNGSTTSSSQSSSARSLEIEEVYVEAGEEVTEETPVLKLTADSVESIRTELEEDAAEAKLVYEQAVTANKQAAAEAEADFSVNTLYEDYSDFEYTEATEALQEAVEEKQEALESATETLEEAKQELTEKQELLEKEKEVLANAEFTEEGTDKEENLYWWIVAWETREEAEDMVESLETETEELTVEIEEYEKEVTSAELALSLAKKDLEEGTIDAEYTRQERVYLAENAQEIYDVAVEQGAFDEQTALSAYQEAQEKLTEFDRIIVEQTIYAESSGVITDVNVEKGDTLTQNMDIISLNDYNSVTITLSILEDDMEAAALGNKVLVTVAAFPDEVLEGEVTEIGDAEIDSSTNKTTYSVTVTVQNPGNLLYQDMTADVTFGVE